MLYKMKLRLKPFEKIKNGIKTVELRLNDEKRQQIQVGDYIEFTLIDNNQEKIYTQVLNLYHFNTFKDLYSNIPKEKIGYKINEIPDPEHMNIYYSKESELKYGVLGIEIKLTDKVYGD